MTKARMDWRRMELTLEGHANSGPHGQDIVCAAISILTQSLINTLADLQMKYHYTELEWSGDQAEGRMKIKATVSWANLSAVRSCFEVCVTGLRMIGNKYPEYIELEEE